MDLSILPIVAGIVTAAIGVVTFIKAIREYQLQGVQKRLDLFLDMRRKFKDNKRFKTIAALIDEDPEKLTEISFKEKRDYAGFFQEVALMANSDLIKKCVAYYMFGYFAARCYDSETFWTGGINKDTIYWRVLKEFVLETKKMENSDYKCVSEGDFRL